MDHTNPKTIRQETFAELVNITAIERGTLTEEFRQRPAPDGNGTVRLGPYYKHQCWENGKNRSARVPPGQVAQVREQIENGRRFDELTATLEQLALVEGRSQRGTPSEPTVAADAGAKKNSPNNASRKDTAKPKRSSAPSTRHSPEKG